MRILFLTPYLPYPPNKGTALRNLHLLRGAARNHQAHLLTFGRESDRQAVEVLRRELAQVEMVSPPQRSTMQRLAGVPSAWPDLASRLYSPDFRQKLMDLLETTVFDLVQVEGLEMAPYAIEVRRWRGPKDRPLLLLDDHNAEYLLQRSAYRADLGDPRRWTKAVYSLIQWQKLIRYEREVCRMSDVVLAVSQADAAALWALDSRLHPKVIPNGVDTSFFGYRSMAGRLNGEPPTLIFTGTMDYRPNVDAVVWFCRQVLPLVRRQLPATRLLLVGRDPSPAVRGLAGPNEEVTGPVDDVRPYLYQSNVFVAPLRMGSGTRLKILEAMSCGLPVVSTTMGIEGIGARSGQEALVADNPRDFAGRILDLLSDLPRSQELATRARLLVEQRYDWKVILPEMTQVYESLDRRRP